MSYSNMTRFDVVAHVQKGIAKAGSLRAWARLAKVTPAYVSDVVTGRRDPGPKILAVLKIEKVPAEAQRYRHVKP